MQLYGTVQYGIREDKIWNIYVSSAGAGQGGQVVEEYGVQWMDEDGTVQLSGVQYGAVQYNDMRENKCE